MITRFRGARLHLLWLLSLGIFFWPCTSSAQTKIHSGQINQTGNNSWTGQNAITAYNVNNIVYVDGNKYACSDVGLNAAIAVVQAFGDLGGMVDASGCTASSYNISSTVTLGSITKTVSVRLNSRTAWICDSAGSTPCWDLWAGSSIICDRTGANNCSLDLSSSTVPSVVRINPSQVQEQVQLKNIEVRNTAGGIPTVALVDVSSAYDSQFWLTITISAANTTGLYIHGASSAICPNADTFSDLLISGGFQVGSQPISIKADTDCLIGPLNFFGGDFGHSGTANSILRIDGHGKAGGVFGLNFTGLYMEDYNSDRSTPPMIYVNDAMRVSFNSIHLNRLNASAAEFGYELHESASGRTGAISWSNGTVTGGPSHNFIQNDITSVNSLTNVYTFVDFINTIELGTANFGAQIENARFSGATGTVSETNTEYCGATTGATQACSKTVQTLPVVVWGDVQLNTATSQSITTLPFTDALYSCTGSDLTTATGIVSFNTYAAASVTIQESGGINTDHLRYICVGR